MEHDRAAVWHVDAFYSFKTTKEFISKKNKIRSDFDTLKMFVNRIKSLWDLTLQMYFVDKKKNTEYLQINPLSDDCPEGTTEEKFSP